MNGMEYPHDVCTRSMATLMIERAPGIEGNRGDSSSKRADPSGWASPCPNRRRICGGPSKAQNMT